MRIPLTLAAEIVLASRRGLISIAAIFAAAALLVMLPLSSLQSGGLLNDLMLLPLIISLALLFAVFNYTEHHARTGNTGFPNRLFTFPISTFTLVTCPIVCGVLAVTALYCAWVLLIMRPIGRQFLLTWPALVLGCGMVCYHCILWSLAAHRLARMIVLSLLGTILVAIALLPMVYGESASQPRIAMIFIAVALAAYLIALASVHRQRHAGGVRSSAGLLLQRGIELIPTSSTPFRSAAHALFWLEFRRGGLILPFATGVILLCFIFIAMLSYPMAAEVTALAFIWAALLPLILSIFVGKSFASDSVVPSFIAIRPASAGDLLFAKLRAAALSTGISWLLVIVLVPLWLMLCDTTIVQSWWHAARAYFDIRFFAILPLLLLSLILLTWRSLIISTPTGLLGRPRLHVVHSILSNALIVAIAIAFPWLMDQYAAGRFSFSFLSNATTVPILSVVLFLKLTLGLYLWHRFLAPHALYLLIWTIATLTLAACAYLATARIAVVLVALCLFPLARIPLAAISLAHNRHR